MREKQEKEDQEKAKTEKLAKEKKEKEDQEKAKAEKLAKEKQEKENPKKEKENPKKETAPKEKKQKERKQGDQLQRSLRIGNTHKLTNSIGSDNKHIWKMFVELLDTEQEEILEEDASEVIDKVTFHLHPTFSPPSITVSEPPFEISRIGWGYFEVKVTVYWKNQNLQPSKFRHMLSFEQDETSRIENFDCLVASDSHQSSSSSSSSSSSCSSASSSAGSTSLSSGFSNLLLGQ